MDFSHQLGNSFSSRGWGPRPEGLLFGRSLKKKISKTRREEFPSCISQLGCLGGFNNRNLFFTFLEAGRSKIKPPDLVSAEAHFLACS